MSIKIAMMAFQALAESGVTKDVTPEDLFAADVTNRLQNYPESARQQNIEAAALKSSWSRDRRTGRYAKF